MRLLVLLIGVSLHGISCQSERHDASQPEDGKIQNVVQEFSNEIEVLVKENDLLRQNTTKLKKDCDDNFQEHWNIFNELLKKVKSYQPGVEDLERNVTIMYDQDEELENSIKEVKNYTRVLILKRKIIQEDVMLLNRRQGEYELCTEFAHLINFEPVTLGKIGLRSLSRNVVSPKSKNDIAAFALSRKMTWLTVQKEQELYRNEELKKYQVYFTGFCSRRLENIQKLIEYLKKHPESAHVEGLKEEYHKLEKLVSEKKAQLKADKHNLQSIIDEIEELQKKYVSMINIAKCFSKLSDWHVKKYIEEIDKDIHNPSRKTDETGTTATDVPPEVEVTTFSEVMEE